MVANAMQKLPRSSWERVEKLRVKRLFLVSGCLPKEIGEKVGRPAHQVSNLIWKNGWGKLKRIAEEKAEALVESDATASAVDFIESIGSQCEEIAETGLGFARDTIRDKDAKGFALTMSGVKTAVGLVRQARGMDAQAQGTSISISAVFGRPEPIQVHQAPAEQLASPGDSEDLDFA